jgi:hypothetical protein
MELELVEKLFHPSYPQANYEHVYEPTKCTMSGTATYDNGNREKFYAVANVGMYGAISMRLSVHHPISLTNTEVCVTLNKAAFDKTGIKYNDMDEVLPRLIDHATMKYYEGMLLSKCVGIELDKIAATDSSEFFEMLGVHDCALRVWKCMRHDYMEFTIRSEYVEGRYIPEGKFNEFVHELKGMGACISKFAPGKYVTIQA